MVDSPNQTPLGLRDVLCHAIMEDLDNMSFSMDRADDPPSPVGHSEWSPNSLLRETGLERSPSPSPEGK